MNFVHGTFFKVYQTLMQYVMCTNTIANIHGCAKNFVSMTVYELELLRGISQLCCVYQLKYVYLVNITDVCIINNLIYTVAMRNIGIYEY